MLYGCSCLSHSCHIQQQPASGTAPCRIWSRDCPGHLYRDPLLSRPGTGGKGSKHKKSSLLNSSPMLPPCSKDQQGKRDLWRVFTALIWALCLPWERNLGKPLWGLQSSLGLSPEWAARGLCSLPVGFEGVGAVVPAGVVAAFSDEGKRREMAALGNPLHAGQFMSR